MGVGGGEKWRDDYWTLSKLPLHGLLFLVPLIVLYEIGSVAYLRNGSMNLSTQIRAESLLHVFFEFFGVIGLLAPGILMAVVLLVMHLQRRDRWLVRPMVLVGMALESAMWVLPLIVLAAVVSDAVTRAAAAGLEVGAQELAGFGWQARATIAVGAGLYEELLFRLIGIAVLDWVLSSLVESRVVRAVICVGLTALAFAVYHDAAFTVDPVHGRGVVSVVRSLLSEGPGYALSRVVWGNLVFYVAAGVYFAWIYLSRGFGVVVGTHAAYDLAVLVLLSRA